MEQQLREIVESGIWRDDPELLNLIYHRYCELLAVNKNVTNVLTKEFWDAIIDDPNYTDVQQGGYVVDANLEPESGEQNLNDFYVMKKMSEVKVKRFNTMASSYRVSFRNMEKADDLFELLPQILNQIMEQAYAQAADNDLVGLRINHPCLDKPILIPFCRRVAMTPERVLSLIERVAQSKKALSFLDNEAMVFELVIVTPPEGKGKPRNGRAKIANWDEWFNSHCGRGGCFVQIQNNDNLCCPRALITAKARIDKDPQYKSIRNGDQERPNSVQRTRALQLMKDVGLEQHKGSCGIPELQLFQNFLAPDYQIIVFAKECFNSIIFEGPTADKKLHLLLHDDHFDVVTKPAGFMGSNYYCTKCNTGYSNREKHKCERGECLCCNSTPECQFEQWLYCKECNRQFKSRTCFDKHKSTTNREPGHAKAQRINSICETIKRCPKCKVILHNKHWIQKHMCAFFECNICHSYVLRDNHKCYIKPLKDDDKKNKKRRAVFLFFDFETTQNTVLQTNEYGYVYHHIPNLCVVHRVCDVCRHNPTLGTCKECGGENKHVFKGDDCLDKFCQFLFSIENRGATAIAHNSRGFDSQFILEYLHRQGAVPPKVITRGLQLMMIEAGEVRVIDSLNFLPMALAAMPKTFGEEELAKGYFCHFFNTSENQNYVGPLPDAHFYGPSSMKADKREKFFEWYNQEKAANRPFDLQKELLQYCNSDVDVLRRCTLKFRDIFMKETNGVDPLLTSLTIASACNRVFRRNFLKPDTIGIVPSGGYKREERQSIIALKWLKWLAQSQNIRIRHKLNGGEIKIGSYKVDGLLDTDDGRKVVYEFNGCWWHGCPKCVKNRESHSADPQYTVGEVYERTLARQRALEDGGYTVMVKWECDLQRELKVNPEMQEFFDKTQLMEPMTGRESFFGGRTNSIKLYHRCSDGERISYIDVCSLYPFICKTGIFPLGHPKIITENFLPFDAYQGIIKCTVVPPHKLYHPVLPSRHNNKLMFPCCFKCAENLEQEGECNHTDDERALTGAWTHLELRVAVKKGYNVIALHEIWQYEKWAKYDPYTKTGGLFAEYINTFLRLKQQSDGWPSTAQTEAERHAYIKEYERVEGVKLDPNQVEKNQGLRALSKLCLNSFWGKFGQRNNLTKTEYFTEPSKYFETIFDPTKIIQGVSFYGENMVSVPYTNADEFADVLSNTNVVIASYVTSQARLKLYTYLDQLQERVLYMDTDSIIYLTHPNDTYVVPTGCYLGEMTNELQSYGESCYISEFVGAGPKNYGYRVFDPTKNKVVGETLKVRGFQIDYAVGKSVNFNVMKRMVLNFVTNFDNSSLNVVQNRILRMPNRTVVSKVCKKDYRVVYNKRKILPNFCTVPYGY